MRNEDLIMYGKKAAPKAKGKAKAQKMSGMGGMKKPAAGKMKAMDMMMAKKGKKKM